MTTDSKVSAHSHTAMDTPKVDFNQDPLTCAQVYRFTNETSTSYLIALAAWQRGLDVTFYSELASQSEQEIGVRVKINI